MIRRRRRPVPLHRSGIPRPRCSSLEAPAPESRGRVWPQRRARPASEDRVSSRPRRTRGNDLGSVEWAAPRRPAYGGGAPRRARWSGAPLCPLRHPSHERAVPARHGLWKRMLDEELFLDCTNGLINALYHGYPAADRTDETGLRVTSTARHGEFRSDCPDSGRWAVRADPFQHAYTWRLSVHCYTSAEAAPYTACAPRAARGVPVP